MKRITGLLFLVASAVSAQWAEVPLAWAEIDSPTVPISTISTYTLGYPNIFSGSGDNPCTTGSCVFTLSLANQNAGTFWGVQFGSGNPPTFIDASVANGQCLGRTGNNWASLACSGGGGGAVATDVIWDAAGDLAVGTGADTAARLAPGTSTQVLHGGASPAWGAIVNADITNTTINLTTKVTGLLPLANFADGSNISVLGRSANSSGVMAPIQCTAASDAVIRESGSTLGCGTVATAGIANSAITLAKIQNAAANSKLVGSGAAGSGAAYSELTLGTNLSMSGTTLNSTAGSTASDTIWDAAGDLVQGTGADTAAKLSAPAVPGYIIRSNGASAALSWDNPFMNPQFIGGAEEFVQSVLNNTTANGGTIVGVDDSAAPQQGIYRFTISTTAASLSGQALNRGTTGGRPIKLNAGGVSEFSCRLGGFSTLSDPSTDQYQARCGFIGDPTSLTPDGFYVEYVQTASANWRYCASQSNTQSCVSTSTAVATGATNLFTIRCSTNAAYNSFTCVDKNGTSLGSAITTNLPTTNVGVGVVIVRTGGTPTSTETMDVDYLRWSQSISTVR